MPGDIPNDLQPVDTSAVGDIPHDLQPAPPHIVHKFTVGTADSPVGTPPPIPQPISPGAKPVNPNTPPSPLSVGSLQDAGGALEKSFLGGAAEFAAQEIAEKRADIYGQDDPFVKSLKQTAQDIHTARQAPSPTNAATVGTGFGTGMLGMVSPGVAGVGVAAGQLEDAAIGQDQGQTPDPHFALRALGEGAKEYALNRLLGSGATGAVSTATTAAAQPLLGAAAKPVARAATGFGLMAGSQALGNVIEGQPLLQGTGTAGVQGAAQEVGFGALHDVAPAIKDVIAKAFKEGPPPIDAQNPPPETPNKGFVRGPDTPLSPLGRQQVADLGQNLQSRGGFTSVDTSGVPRTNDTAQALGQPFNQDPRWQSVKRGIFTGQDVKDFGPVIDYFAKKAPDIPIPGGESENQMQARVGQAMTEKAAQYAQDPTQRPAVVAHNAIINLTQAAVDQGVFPDLSKVDTSKLPREGDGTEVASAHRIYQDANGKWQMEDVDPKANTPLEPGMYFIRHGDTPFNPGPNYPAAPASEATPAAPPTPQGPAVTQAETSPQATGAAGLFKKLAASEEGGAKVPEAAKVFGERVVKPAVENLATAVKKTSDNVNRLLGTGLGEGAAEKQVGHNIRESFAQQDLDRIRTEEEFKPAREKIGAMDDVTKTATMDQIEKGENPSGDKHIQQLIDTNQSLNAQNKAEAEKYGVDTTKWDSGDDWVGRMAEFPPQKGPGTRTSIAGPEAYLKSRVYDTYSEFKQAVEAAGGKMRYDNPVDAMLAKHAEVRQSIEARRLLSNDLEAGIVEKLKPGDSLPEGKDFLDDRLAKKMAGKTQLWVDPKTGEPAMKPPPRLIADAGVANKYNQFIAPGVGKTLPIWDHIVAAKRASVGMNFALSAWHVPVETVGTAGIAFGQAVDNALHGEWGLAGKNLLRTINPVGVGLEGSKIRQQAANPEYNPSLEPYVQASVKGGQRFNLRSVLNPTAFERARAAYEAGDKISGTARFMQGIAEKVNSPIMDRMVPNMKAGAMKIYAETLMSRGVKGPEFDAAMSKASDNVDNVLGQVVRTNQFQHKVVSDLMDGIFSAPKFAEGALRLGGAAVRDSVEALSGLRKGKIPTITPAMQTVAGLAVVTAGLGAATQMAYTAATTGKVVPPSSVKDYFYPRTGKKNADGSDERVSLPNPAAMLLSAVTEGPGKAVMNRVAPIWRAMMDVAQNADYKNVKVREGGVLQQTGQSLAHIAKSQVPFSMQNIVERPSGPVQTPGEKALAGLGIRRAPSAVQHSAAENALYDMTPHDTRTQEQAAKSDLEDTIGKLQGAQRLSAQQAALKAGTLTNKDLDKVAAPHDFVHRLKDSNLAPSDLMTVWGKMTPEEKQKTAWVLRAKINSSSQVQPDEARGYLRQITADLRGQ